MVAPSVLAYSLFEFNLCGGNFEANNIYIVYYMQDTVEEQAVEEVVAVAPTDNKPEEASAVAPEAPTNQPAEATAEAKPAPVRARGGKPKRGDGFKALLKEEVVCGDCNGLMKEHNYRYKHSAKCPAKKQVVVEEVPPEVKINNSTSNTSVDEVVAVDAVVVEPVAIDYNSSTNREFIRGYYQYLKDSGQQRKTKYRNLLSGRLP